MKKYVRLLKSTYESWMKNDAFEQSAVIAYYTIFSLPSLLVVIIAIAGYFFGKSTVQGEIIDQLSMVIGESSAASLEKMISNVNVDDGSMLGLAVSIGVLIFGATGAFFKLKKSMNKIWGVREKKSGILIMLLDRAISMGMIFLIGLLIITSFVITAVITMLGDFIEIYAPALTSGVLKLFNLGFSWLLLTFLFAAVFKLLPDIKLRWRIAFTGATLTTVLFLLAEFGLNIYFSKSNPTSVFGGASSVILIMLWIYYFCLILFLGAEFTVQYALFKNEKIKPNRFSEPAFIQSLDELKKDKIYMEERKKLMEGMKFEEDED